MYGVSVGGLVTNVSVKISRPVGSPTLPVASESSLVCSNARTLC
jgi:hypothetical protein